MNVQLSAHTYDRLRTMAGLGPRVFRDLHAKQRAFVGDTSSRKVACCGRRGGKSTGVGLWLYEGMLLKPGTRQVYIALSRETARQILWDLVLSPLNRQYGLGLTMTGRGGQYMVEHPNGSSLWIVGCSDQYEIDKFRGQKFFRVCIDEAQAFGPFLEQLIVDAIEPALMDYRGQLALTGTPSLVPHGFFHDASTGLAPGWSRHHWTVLDNPYIQDPAGWLAEQRAKNNWTEVSPTYQREYLGLWKDDAGARIYPFTHDANAWVPGVPEGQDIIAPDAPYLLPDGDYQYGLGIDLGFSENSTAFLLVANRRGMGQLYCLKAYTRSRMTPMALTAHVQGIREAVRNETGQGLTVVVDEGALGAGYGEQMRESGVFCEAAKKTEKRSYQEWVGGLVSTGAVKVDYSACRPLLEEASKLQWDPETGKEDERYTRHCCDAFLYITRALFPRYSPEMNQPIPGTPEAIRAEMAALKAKAIKDREKRNKRRAA